MIQYQMHKPQGPVAEYVRFFWSLDACVQNTDRPFVHRALPDNCIELIFYCKGKLSISTCDGGEGYTFSSGVFGQTQKFRQFRTDRHFHLFGVYLYPYLFRTLFNIPPSELLNLKVESATLWGQNGRNLEEQVMIAGNDEERIRLVSDFLLKRISVMKTYERDFMRNVKSVIDNNSVHSVDAFAHHCNLSRRQFERKFREYSGLSPKAFFNIVRFKNAVTEIGLRKKSLAQVALDTGYYDQSHFINEFRKLSGYSPREFLMNHSDAEDTRVTVDFKD